MGKQNDVLLDYFDDNDRFADFFNGILFQGRPEVRAEELEEAEKMNRLHLELTKVKLAEVLAARAAIPAARKAGQQPAEKWYSALITMG